MKQRHKQRLNRLVYLFMSNYFRHYVQRKLKSMVSLDTVIFKLHVEKNVIQYFEIITTILKCIIDQLIVINAFVKQNDMVDYSFSTRLYSNLLRVAFSKSIFLSSANVSHGNFSPLRVTFCFRNSTLNAMLTWC